MLSLQKSTGNTPELRASGKAYQIIWQLPAARIRKGSPRTLLMPAGTSRHAMDRKPDFSMLRGTFGDLKFSLILLKSNTRLALGSGTQWLRAVVPGYIIVIPAISWSVRDCSQRSFHQQGHVN